MFATEKQHQYIQGISNAMYDGEYNIKMLIASYYTIDYPSYKKVYNSDIEWGSWDKSGYIYRYAEQKFPFVHKRYRINSITPLNFYVPEKNQNGEWVLNKDENK